MAELTKSECEQIAEILERRANEIATYKEDYIRNKDYLGSVDFALSRESQRLRRLAGRVNPSIVEDDGL
jgi:hypothetical protein